MWLYFDPSLSITMSAFVISVSTLKALYILIVSHRVIYSFFGLRNRNLSNLMNVVIYYLFFLGFFIFLYLSVLIYKLLIKVLIEEFLPLVGTTKKFIEFLWRVFPVEPILLKTLFKIILFVLVQILVSLLYFLKFLWTNSILGIWMMLLYQIDICFFNILICAVRFQF